MRNQEVNLLKLLGKKEKHQKKRLENLLYRSKMKQKIVILKESRYEKWNS